MSLENLDYKPCGYSVWVDDVVLEYQSFYTGQELDLVGKEKVMNFAFQYFYALLSLAEGEYSPKEVHTAYRHFDIMKQIVVNHGELFPLPKMNIDNFIVRIEKAMLESLSASAVGSP